MTLSWHEIELSIIFSTVYVYMIKTSLLTGQMEGGTGPEFNLNITKYMYLKSDVHINIIYNKHCNREKWNFDFHSDILFILHSKR